LELRDVANKKEMSTAAQVFDKMKDWSKKTLNFRHRILLNDIAAELSISQDSLLGLLTELENAGLVKIYRTDVASVSLTSYGVAQENYSSPEEGSPSGENPSS
jgi:DNA-binding MarR family transcriptional regulator